MSVGHDLGRTNEAPPRFSRQGRLAPQFGAAADAQVRAACDACGTHLLAIPQPDGRLEGTCPVCLNRRVTRVEARQQAA
jgi:hypothetical protein